MNERVVNLSNEDRRMEAVLEKAEHNKVLMGQSEIHSIQNDDTFIPVVDSYSQAVKGYGKVEKVELEGSGEMQDDMSSTIAPELESTRSSLLSGSNVKKQKKRKLKKGKVRTTGGDFAFSNTNRCKRNKGNKLLLEAKID
jgi:hypothetical protein